ncbi:hypothetical protein [Faecalibaculum rodentium]|nr:hypothetical protein [Faecalibaculum rodentium]
MFENLVKPFTEECEKNGLKPFGVIAIKAVKEVAEGVHEYETEED